MNENRPITTPEAPRPSVAEMQSRLAAELSTKSRAGYVLLLLFDLAVLAAVGSLWLTEPELPLRTHLAFGGIVLGTLAWAAFFAWTLARRKVLLARHRVVAGRIAVTFTGLFTAGALLLAALVVPMRAPGLAAGVFGVALLAVAWLVLRRARDRFDELRDRVQRLQAELG